MEAIKLVRDALTLSGGRLARLFGTANYSEIDAILNRWFEWAESQKGTWSTLEDCYSEFDQAK